MKKTNKTYLLLAVVLSVWGVIGFKVLKAVNPAPEKPALVVSNDTFVPKQLKERDTFSLVADYRDPFLGTFRSPKKEEKKKVKAIAPAIPERSINYTGFIGDTDSKQQIFFVTIDGYQQMMGINDTFQGIKLVGGNNAEIRVRYKGKTRSIALNP